MSLPVHRFVPLRPGDRVAVVSTSGTIDPYHLSQGIEWLRTRYRVEDDARRFARTGFLAGSDEDRATALLEALEDDAVRAVFVSRGGYGAMRLLEREGERMRAALRRDPKPIVGFSDVTALHALWGQEGVVSVHGPMIASIGRGNVRDRDRDATVRLLESGQLAAWEKLDVLRAGDAIGRAAGGNLALIASLAGTPFAMNLDGCVLFVEDVGERPYRVDRMLTQLRLTGALRKVRGIVLGDFTDCEAGPDGRHVREVLHDRLVDLGVPVYANAPFGHDGRQQPFAYGAIVRLGSGCVRFDTLEIRANASAV
jgi:muramoyltetrapeptide carboxypeptidase